jgi:CO dehydrogenase/acetyl-CoA synthase beta subunit
MTMELFGETLVDIRKYIEGKKCRSLVAAEQKTPWPSGKGRNVVLSDDMAVELGSPQMNSVSCLIWTQKADLVRDGKITLLGPDIKDSQGKSLPFGKVVLLGVSGFDEESAYDKYKEMEAVRYSLDLKGYMIRAVSQYQREWSRISREAVEGGFSFEALGSALREEYLKKDFIHAVEFLFVTSSAEDVGELQEITKNVGRTISAMNKMLSEIDPDCDECEYNDVCDEVDELKGMKKTRDEKRINTNG